MRRSACFLSLTLGCLVLGCATMRTSDSRYPGITEPNPNAVTRVFPASATLVAQRMTDVMGQEEILDAVAMVPDTASKEYRNFSKADRQALGISLLTPANDVNFNITAKCKDRAPVAVAVRLKGESSAEVSVLYGFGGDPDLSRDLLDKLQAALPGPAEGQAVTRVAGDRKPDR